MHTTLVFSQLPRCLDQGIYNGKAFYNSQIQVQNYISSNNLIVGTETSTNSTKFIVWTPLFRNALYSSTSLNILECTQPFKLELIYTLYIKSLSEEQVTGSESVTSELPI